jgi:hypothetical protein
LILLKTSFWFKPWDLLARRWLFISYLLANLERIVSERLAKEKGRRQTYHDNLLAKQNVADDNDKALCRSF